MGSPYPYRLRVEPYDEDSDARLGPFRATFDCPLCGARDIEVLGGADRDEVAEWRATPLVCDRCQDDLDRREAAFGDTGPGWDGADLLPPDLPDFASGKGPA